MRVTIEVDDALMAEVRDIVGGRSKRDVVHRALRAVVEQELRRQLVRLRGDGMPLGDVPRRTFAGDELASVDWSAFGWAAEPDETGR